MLARGDGQRGFFDAAWCSGLLPERSIYAVLAEHGERIVCDEDFAECYSTGTGRPSIPPSLLAKVLEMLSWLQRPLSEFSAELPEVFVSSVAVRCPWDAKGKVMRHLTE